MPKDMNEKNLSVFSDVIMSLASDAAAEVDGVEVLRSKDRSKRAIRGGGVSVYFLPNDKVAVDVYVNVNFPCRVPEAVAAVQQRVKEEIEGATRFRVHSVNVQVVSVLFPAPFFPMTATASPSSTENETPFRHANFFLRNHS